MNHKKRKKNTKILKENFSFISKKKKNALINRGKAKKKENIIILCIVAGLMENYKEKKATKKKVREIFMKIKKENYAVSELKTVFFFFQFLFFIFSGLEK